MQMTNSEIAASYRLAADPKKQIGILADLNDCTRTEIVDALRKEGIKLPGSYNAKKVETPKAAMQQPETPEAPKLRTEATEADGSKRKLAELTAVEDVLALVFGALDDYTEASAEEPRSEAAFIGYMMAVRDTYEALRGPIVR